MTRMNKALAPAMKNGMVCDKCKEKCPGFEGHLLHPHLCKWCGCSANAHNTANPKHAMGDDDDDDG